MFLVDFMILTFEMGPDRKRDSNVKINPLGKPPKTPDNSSTPPSAGQKPNLLERQRKGREGRPGVTRALAANPDHVIEALAAQCPNCAAALSQVRRDNQGENSARSMPTIISRCRRSSQ